MRKAFKVNPLARLGLHRPTKGRGGLYPRSKFLIPIMPAKPFCVSIYMKLNLFQPLGKIMSGLLGDWWPKIFLALNDPTKMGTGGSYVNPNPRAIKIA